jgi:hypothetical protein
VTAVYNALAAGRYAAEWLPEYLELYQDMVELEGEDAALAWASGELLRSFKPAMAARALWILRAALAAWKVYRAVVG